jgi:hypothetical protein
MKLTESKLKQLINEVISEVRVKNSSLAELGLQPDKIDKIHALIDGGSEAQAQVLIDTFADVMGITGFENYAENHIEYPQVGDLEKLGNDYQTTPYYDQAGVVNSAEDLVKSKADRLHGTTNWDVDTQDDEVWNDLVTQVGSHHNYSDEMRKRFNKNAFKDTTES